MSSDETTEIYIDGIVVIQPTHLSKIQNGDIIWYQLVGRSNYHGPFLYQESALINTSGAKLDMIYFNTVTAWFIQVPLTEKHFRC